MLFLTPDPLVILGAIGVLITIFYAVIQISDRLWKGSKGEADWVRGELETEDSYFGTTGVSRGEVYRHPPRDPSNLREPDGLKRLNRYCPRLWKLWVELRDAREARNDKLNEKYRQMKSILESGVIAQADVPINRVRLIDSFDEDVTRISKRQDRIIYEIDPAANRLLARGYNDPIATGESLQRLLDIIHHNQSLPFIQELGEYLRKYDQSNVENDSRWYEGKTHCIETLVSKYSLPKKTFTGMP